MANASVGSAGNRAGDRPADQRAAHLNHLLSRQGRPRHSRHNHIDWWTSIFMSVPLPMGSGLQSLPGRP